MDAAVFEDRAAAENIVNTGSQTYSLLRPKKLRENEGTMMKLQDSG